MIDLENTMFKGKKVALHFSGGKDSLACLYYLKPHWAEIDVVWCNTGAAFPETIEQMAKIRTTVPRFIEVRSDQPANNVSCGVPADIVPVSHTPLHNVFTRGSNPLIQSFVDCCRANIWLPMHEASLGYDVIIRGQKESDHKKAPVKSGERIDGVEYYFPLEDWTDDDVYQYLAENDIELPITYKYFGSSADCWSCTAFLSESKGKRTYLAKFHPEKYEVVSQRIILIKNAIADDFQYLEQE